MMYLLQTTKTRWQTTKRGWEQSTPLCLALWLSVLCCDGVRERMRGGVRGWESETSSEATYLCGNQYR